VYFNNNLWITAALIGSIVMGIYFYQATFLLVSKENYFLYVLLCPSPVTLPPDDVLEKMENVAVLSTHNQHKQ
jgi:hypothetical protein